MGVIGDDAKLFIEAGMLVIAVGSIVWRTSGLSTKLEADGARRASEITDIKTVIGERFGKVEAQVSQIQSILISEAQQNERIRSMDERIAAMDQRSLAQGARIDSTATIINGRLEAINNIVSGHTAQLNNLPRKTA